MSNSTWDHHLNKLWKALHARIKWALSEGVQLWQRFFFSFFLVDEGGRSTYNFYNGPSLARQRTPFKRVIIDPPAKRSKMTFRITCRWWPNIEYWLGRCTIFRGSGPVLLENPIFLWFFGGGGGYGVWTPSPPLDPSHAIFRDIQRRRWFAY